MVSRLTILGLLFLTGCTSCSGAHVIWVSHQDKLTPYTAAQIVANNKAASKH